MMFPIWLDRLPAIVANLSACRFRWSPIGEPISVHIEDRGDPYLVGHTADGVIHAYARPRRSFC